MDSHTLDSCAASLGDVLAPNPIGLRAHGGASLDRRWAVHRNTVAVTLREALAASFPVARQLVGDAFFYGMSSRYIAADPPRSPVLSDYGDSFPSDAEGVAAAAGVPYLPDVMRLERLHACVTHAVDAVPVSAAAFHRLVADPLRLAATCVRMHPACGWLRSAYAVGSLWAAHPAGRAIDEMALTAIDTDTPEDVLVARPVSDVAVVTLPPGAIEWLAALRAGSPIGAALAVAMEAQPSAIPTALFGLLVNHGLVAALQPLQETTS